MKTSVLGSDSIRNNLIESRGGCYFFNPLSLKTLILIVMGHLFFLIFLLIKGFVFLVAVSSAQASSSFVSELQRICASGRTFFVTQPTAEAWCTQVSKREFPQVFNQCLTGAYPCSNQVSAGQSSPSIEGKICHVLRLEYCPGNACSELDCGMVENSDTSFFSNYSYSCLVKVKQCQNSPSGRSSPRGEGEEPADALFHQLEVLTSRCESESDSVQSSCTQTPSDLTSTLKTIADQTTAAISQSALDACSAVAKNSSAVQSALSVARVACGAYYEKCNSSCELSVEELKFLEKKVKQEKTQTPMPEYLVEADSHLIDYKERLTKARKKCREAQGHLKNIHRDMENIGFQLQKSSECAMKLSADGSAPVTYEQCLLNPSLKGCEFFKGIGQQNCDNPQFAATNKVCQCRTNPGDPQCRNANQNKIGQGFNPHKGLDGGASGEDSGSSSSPLGLVHDAGFSNDEGWRNQSPPPSSGEGLGGGGASGGGGFLGMGGGGGSLNEPMQKNKPGPGGSGGSRWDTQVLGRSGGGSGGFLSGLRNFFSGRNPSSEGDPAQDQGNKKHSGKASLSSLDLKQFLPGGSRDPSRRVSSVSGPDGMTGPFSDNFKKINARYVSLRQTFR
jgi:hypothetical protein